VDIAPELLTALASGTAGAAGQQLWASLGALLRRRPPDAAPTGEEELSALGEHTDDTARARELANVLVLRAEQDPAFARALEEWRGRAEQWHRATADSGEHRNEISGGEFNGPVIIARDINGPMTFGQ
jgi:hypothetical protein